MTGSQPGGVSDDEGTGAGESTPTLREVRLLQLPVALHAKAQEHSAELLREMYLMAQQLRYDAVSSSEPKALPARLVQLIEALTSEFSGFTTEQDRDLDQAVERGVESIDVVYRLPITAAPAAAQLGEMLDEADEFCRQGKHLLTLATPSELLRYRRWYLGEFANQLAARPATPWPEYHDPA